MTVLVTGATGVFGHRIVERLADRGHHVLGLTRDDAGADLIEGRGGHPIRGDLLERETLVNALDDRDIDVVVHAATKLPPGDRTRDEYWERNDHVRREGARNLLAVIGDDIERFVFPSVVWVARQPDGSTIEETAEPNPGPYTQSAADVEEMLDDSGDRGFDPAILRMGLFYGPDDHLTRDLASRLLSGEFRIVGRGLLGRKDAEWSLLHVDDAARAIAEAVDGDVTGRYHVADDEPVTVAELARTFADKLNASEPGRVPWWVARPIMGKGTVKFFTHPMPTTSERFREATGWEPRYPTYREGLQQIVETWGNDGTLRELREGASADETLPEYREGTSADDTVQEYREGTA